MKEYNTQKAITAQSNYCSNKGLPYFAPSSGVCYKCRQNIYAEVKHVRNDWKTGSVIGEYVTGIDVEEAGNVLVTGCPHCNRSYCD